MTRTCQRCGKILPAEAGFCRRCGQSLPRGPSPIRNIAPLRAAPVRTQPVQLPRVQPSGARPLGRAAAVVLVCIFLIKALSHTAQRPSAMPRISTPAPVRPYAPRIENPPRFSPAPAPLPQSQQRPGQQRNPRGAPGYQPDAQNNPGTAPQPVAPSPYGR